MRAGEASSGITLVDTHAHLCDTAFEHDLEEVLACARRAGIAKIVAVGETLDDARRNLYLSRAHPEIVAAAGLFPSIVDEAAAADMIAFIEEHHDEIAAVGEVGLDRWVVDDPELQERQRAIFASFVDLAISLDLPLNVHSRSAGRRTVELLLEKGARRVQLHAFDARAATALPAAEAGYFFSVPPSIVRSRQKQKLVARLPIESLLVETDSPVLGADPAIRNEPAEGIVSARAIAEIHGLSMEEVAERTTANALSLYGEALSR